MHFIKNNPIALAVSFAVTATAHTSLAYSQEEGAMLEEVMVTARKREESLSETPIAITAISAADIQAGAFKNIVDVQKTAPGLFIESMNNENARTVLMPRFRGVTFDATSPLQRTSSVFVDGLIVTSGLHSLPITQVERIEVVKGPQSALFGRNTYSGAINIITRRPGDEFKGGIELDYGAKSKSSTTGFIEGPITSNLGVRATFSYTDKEGHYDNAFVEGQRLGDEETLAYGIMLDFNPTDNLNIMLRASSYEDEDGPGAYAVVGGLAEEHDALDALFAGFPAGTVSGAPKIRACEVIAELEPETRGAYAGGVGYFAPDGSVDSCIVLRTAVVKDGMMHVQAGAGIVADSDPDYELAECKAKAGALLAAAKEAVRVASEPGFGQ